MSYHVKENQNSVVHIQWCYEYTTWCQHLPFYIAICRNKRCSCTEEDPRIVMDTMDTAVTPNFKWEGYDLVKEWRTLMEHVEIGIWLGARGDIYIQRGTY